MITYYPSQAITVHRDQDQARPLYGALENGCQYIELDLHLTKDGELLVGHDKGKRNQTIERVYLKPLRDVNDAGLLKGEFNLIVDIKTKAEETFAALQKVLKKYADILTTYDQKTGLVKRNVKVIISGHRDKNAILEARPRLAFYDGRMSDLSKPDALDPHFMPLISENWGKVVRSKKGYLGLLCCRISDQCIKETMAEKVAIAGEAGIAFRPWAMPENEATWRLLADLKERGFVYNTDAPAKLVKFFEKKQVREEASKPSFLSRCFSALRDFSDFACEQHLIL